jgi:hypothetical protein
MTSPGLFWVSQGRQLSESLTSLIIQSSCEHCI